MSKIDQLTSEQWTQIALRRQEWLDTVITTEPADRETTEAVLTDFYRRLGKPPPTFIWFDGPLSCCILGPLVWALRQATQKRSAQLHEQLYVQLDRQLHAQLNDQLDRQLGDQLDEQLDRQLHAQLYVQLGDQLDRQLDDQLGDQLGGLDEELGGQLLAQLLAQLYMQLDGQLREQLYEQFKGQLRDQLGEQLDAQLDEQLYEQLHAQLHAQLKGQLYVQLDEQLREQLGTQLLAQLDEQLYMQLKGQLDEQLDRQLGDQLDEQLDEQLREQLYAQLYVQLGTQLDEQLREQLKGQLREHVVEQARKVWNLRQWGAERTSWIAHCSIIHDVVGVNFAPAAVELLEQWTKLGKSTGWFFPAENVCFVSERHRIIRFDDRNRLHCPDGPAIECRDGVRVYCWHGQRVPADWIEKRAELTAEAVFAVENVEQRRAGMEIVGWDRILQQLNARLLDEHPDPEIGKLYEVDLPDAPGTKILRMRCGTGRWFAQPVARTVQTAVGAQEWIWDVEPGEYAPEIRT